MNGQDRHCQLLAEKSRSGSASGSGPFRTWCAASSPSHAQASCKALSSRPAGIRSQSQVRAPVSIVAITTSRKSPNSPSE